MYLHDLDLGNGSLDMTPKAHKEKEKINNLTNICDNNHEVGDSKKVRDNLQNGRK